VIFDWPEENIAAIQYSSNTHNIPRILWYTKNSKCIKLKNFK